MEMRFVRFLAERDVALCSGLCESSSGPSSCDLRGFDCCCCSNCCHLESCSSPSASSSAGAAFAVSHGKQLLSAAQPAASSDSSQLFRSKSKRKGNFLQGFFLFSFFLLSLWWMCDHVRPTGNLKRCCFFLTPF